MSSTLYDFATVNDFVAKDAGKLAKQRILADYFRTLDDVDLSRAVRYASGRVFPATSERVTGVSGAIVSDVITQHFGVDRRDYHSRVVRLGEIGEALSDILAEHAASLATHESLTLADLSQTFDKLAETSSPERKRSLVLELVKRIRTPREGAYLAKIMLSDLRTGVREGVIRGAIAEAFGRKLADVQRAELLIGDAGEVALLARRDALHTAELRLFHPIQFMLATPQETAAQAAGTMDGRTYSCEEKLDGIRAQVHKSADGRIAIYTRTLDRSDESFPDVVAAIATIPGEFLLDGEIIPFRDGRVLAFQHLQRRLGRKTLTAKLLREAPAVFIAFDLLRFGERTLLDEPYRVRRELLETQFGGTKVKVSPILQATSVEDIERAFATARTNRNEGLILKDPASIYAPGRRGKFWLKLKTHLPTLDCVVTAAEFGHGKRRGSLSDYTFAVWDRASNEDGATLLNIGKAFSGVTDEEIARLTEIFLSLSRNQIGRVHLVEPKIVIEIAADQIQRSTRHESGFSLRFPRIKRIRWDKRPEDADRIERVREIFTSIDNLAKQDADDAPPEPTLFD